MTRWEGISHISHSLSFRLLKKMPMANFLLFILSVADLEDTHNIQNNMLQHQLCIVNDAAEARGRV